MDELQTTLLVYHAMGGLKDSQDVPMADHCLRVAGAFPHGSTEWYVGMLHDLVEDTNVDFDYLETLGYSAEIRKAVDLLTHVKKEMDYPTYIDRICTSGNETAIQVKIADQTDNLDPKRWVGMGRHRARALEKKWHGVKSKLEEALRETRNARQ